MKYYHQNNCLPEFSIKWLAGSRWWNVYLPNGTFIHLFGDTLLGPINYYDQRPITFVGNSIGLAECYDQKFSIQYL